MFPTGLSQKENGKIRMYIDYRRLNQIPTKDAFPLQRIRDCLESVAGSKYFSILGLTSEYHEVKVKKKDIAFGKNMVILSMLP